MNYSQSIESHYNHCWRNQGDPRYWKKGPMEKHNPDFHVLEFQPTLNRKMWTYATCCMSARTNEAPIELHMFSNKQDESLVEILTAVAFYHQNDTALNLHHTVNFGRPWQDGSLCEYGLISLPYLDGPELEKGIIIQFYWLIPVTKQEVEFKKARGIEELERKFEAANFDYVNPLRASVV